MAIALSELSVGQSELNPHLYSNHVTELHPSRTQQLGDLAHRPHDIQVAVINNALNRYVENHASGLEQGEYPEAAAEKAKMLQNGIDTLRHILSREKESKNYAVIKAKYEEADRESEGKSPAERLAHRLSKFNTIRLVTDFDGTMTKDPNDYLHRIPGSIIAEDLLKRHGRKAFAPTAALSWFHALEQTPETFRQLGREIELREGIKELLENLDGHNIQDMTVLSANFEPIVIGGLDQLGKTADGVRVLAIKPDDIRSTDKGTVLSLLALEDPDTAVVFIGDSESDEEALKALDLIAGIGALKDEGLEKRLEETNTQGVSAPYFTYGNYHDVSVQLQLAQARAQLLAA